MPLRFEIVSRVTFGSSMFPAISMDVFQLDLPTEWQQLQSINQTQTEVGATQVGVSCG
jgi:hypothetical protein